uniref:Protein kinase domain-containing protein n=1 Tax=Physcomitrium patens TaxID=3218 RepID=A0A7I4E6A7_PHYPA
MQIAHQDLKPSNILINLKKKIKNNGEEWIFVKISDFGISKNNVGRTPKIKSNAIIYGTLGYVAPEILDNEDKILKKIRQRERLELPSNCDELTKLIEECWSFNPSQRPNFGNICERLASLKTKFLIGFYEDNGPSFSGSKKKYHQIMKKKETCGDDEVVKIVVIYVLFV